jgi:hypothetical protein
VALAVIIPGIDSSTAAFSVVNKFNNNSDKYKLSLRALTWHACRYVEAMQQAVTPDQAAEDAAETMATGSSNASSGSHVYEKLLAELLGHRSHQVLHQMNKLLLLESQAFGGQQL